MNEARYDELLDEILAAVDGLQERVARLRADLRGDRGRVRDLKVGDRFQVRGDLRTYGVMSTRRSLDDPLRRDVLADYGDGCWKMWNLHADMAIWWVSKAPAESPYSSRAEADEARGLSEYQDAR